MSDRWRQASRTDLTGDDLDRAAALVKVLDSRTRLEILLLLAEEEMMVHQLVTELGKSQPLVSQHLRVLRAAGLVTSDRKGREVLYALAQPGIIAIIEELGNLERLQEAEDELAARRTRSAHTAGGPLDGSAGAAIVGPPADVRPALDPGLLPTTPKPKRD